MCEEFHVGKGEYSHVIRLGVPSIHDVCMYIHNKWAEIRTVKMDTFEVKITINIYSSVTYTLWWL